MARAGGTVQETALVALTCRLVQALEAADVPYALGGALALGYHAPPRGTRDVDLNIFLPAEQAAPAFELLRSAGVDLDVEAATRSAVTRGDAIGSADGIRVDLFVNSIPLHDAALARRQRVEFAQIPCWILSAEDLAVLKLLFNRPKDRIDVEQMCFTLGAEFDYNYAHRQLQAHVGEDERTEVLRRLQVAYGAG